MDECEVAAFFAENEFSDVSESESEDETLPGDYYQGSVVESTPLNNTKTTEVNLREVVVSSKQQSTKTGAGISSTCSCLGMSQPESNSGDNQKSDEWITCKCKKECYKLFRPEQFRNWTLLYLPSCKP